MESNGSGQRWWNGASVTVGIFVVGQFILGVIWGVRLDANVDNQRQILSEHERRISRSDEGFRKIDVIEERQRATLDALNVASKRIETVFELLTEASKQKLLPPNDRRYR